MTDSDSMANLQQFPYKKSKILSPQKKLFSSETAILALERPYEAGQHPTNIKALGRRPPSACVEKWGTQLPVDLAARVQLPLLALPLFFIAAGNTPAEFSVVIGASKNDNNSAGSEYFFAKFFGRTHINIWKKSIYNFHQNSEFENYVVVPK